jgi:Na+-translocating ferredoxin:NAD+ oxidoreductase RnfG subunit
MLDAKITKKTGLLAITLVLIAIASIAILALMTQGVKKAASVTQQISSLPSFEVLPNSASSGVDVKW